ncbi:hypothetical protein MLD38_032046 [Melastoma candidum]|uniref:Uncharacterized protein n=1 Tax=Melastoma candidum TaxID=119954 RepID=A0ACB9MRK9_9MYRT|nr:hypothetical protein MLD38_032046 [Melastoma candidum]
MANIGTARIQVSCSAVKEMKRKIEVEGEDGMSIEIDVHYENIPLRCKECQVFGHSDSQCLRQRPGNRSRSRSRGPGERSRSARSRRRNRQPRVVDGSPRRHSDPNTKAIMWKEMTNDGSSGGSVSCGKAAEPWQRFNVIPAAPTHHIDLHLNRELFNIPLDNDWSIVPYEGDPDGIKCLDVKPLEDGGLLGMTAPLKTPLNDLLTLEGEEEVNTQEEGEEGAIVLLSNPGNLDDSLVDEEDIENRGQQRVQGLTQAGQCSGAPLDETDECLAENSTKMPWGDDVALVNINPSASVRDVLSSEDWCSYINDKPLLKGKELSTAAAWAVMHSTEAQPIWTKWVWLKGIPPRISFVMWLLVKQRLRTADFWHRIGVVGSPLCKGCMQSNETLDHALFLCMKARRIWRLVGRYYEFSGWPASCEDLITFLSLLREARGGRRVIKICLTIVYHLWIERCKLVNEGSGLSLWAELILLGYILCPRPEIWPVGALFPCPRIILRGMARKGKGALARKGKIAKGSKRGNGMGGEGESSSSVRKATGNSPQDPIVVDEYVENVFWQNPNPPQEDEEDPLRDLAYEDLLRWCAEHLPVEDPDGLDPSEDESDVEEFPGMRDPQKGKLSDLSEDSDSEGAEGSFKSCYSGFEDWERVKLEWTYTYRSVWVRRVNKWTCYPMPGHMDEDQKGSAIPPTSYDLALRSTPLGKRVRDWFLRESREKKRLRRLLRIVRHRRVRQVTEVGVQVDWELDSLWSGVLADQVGSHVESGSVELAGDAMDLMDEELMDWGPGAWYCRDVEMVENVYPLANGTGFEGNTPYVAISSRREAFKTPNLMELADKFLHDLALEEDQIARILKCQALRLIAGHLEGTSREFKDIISELNLTVRNNVNRERFVSFERGIGEMQAWDHFNDVSMNRFRTQVRCDAVLNRMNERLSALLLRTELGGERARYPLKLALQRCFRAWKVAARRKIEELSLLIQGWERRMVNMESLVSQRMIPRCANLNFVLQDKQESDDGVVPIVEPAPLSFKEAIELITSALIDSRRPRPPALTSSMIRNAMVRLELIDREESPMLRLRECRELRQMLNGLDGVPAYVGDLHEELYVLALMEAPDADHLPDPVIPASPSSGNSSLESDPWLDERDSYFPSTPEDDGSTGSDS